MKHKSIIPASTAIQTFRDAGYKNTASAIAELIDNSIEANAENVQVLTIESEELKRERVMKTISKIMIYDDGDGMSPDVLGICLQFGNGTRLKSRKGMGRFGIGLPNASVSQCRRVEVYSWQAGECYSTYLDVDEVRESETQTVNDVKKVKMPLDLLKNIEGNVRESGTLVIWEKCDRLDISRSTTLFKRMEGELCRVYRHFLDGDDSYGKQRSVKLVRCGSEREVTELHANDPLYLMTPNNVPGFENSATNELVELVEETLPCNTEGKVGKVQLRFSVALPETQALGGNSPIGQHYRNNTGISFVRAAREIDFGTFGYFNTQDERQRWWGCEVRFEPEFDEVFGVTNNKQAVRGIHFLDLKEFKADHPDDWQHLIEEDPKLAMRMFLSKSISNNLRKINDIITSRGKGSRGGTAKERAELDKSSKIANEELSKSKTKTKSMLEGESKSSEKKIDEWTNALLKSDTTLTEEDAKLAAVKRVGQLVEKTFADWPGAQFFTVETTGSTCNLVINRKHPFFSEMYEPLLEDEDHKLVDALDLTLMAYARTQDELYDRIDEIEEINNTWGSHLKSFLKKLTTDA